MGRHASMNRPERATTFIPLGRQGEKCHEFRSRELSVLSKSTTGTGFETAHLAAFLLSSQAGYMTGAQIVMDGGRSVL